MVRYWEVMINMNIKKEIFQYKIKFIILILFIVLLLALFLLFIKKSFSSYVSDSDLLLNIDHALYIFEEGEINFNIDTDGIVPSDEPYVYTFTLSNYNSAERSDVDISYTIELLSTTNLPLRFELYRNQSYLDSDATNIISLNELVQDEDNSWYRSMKVADSFNFYYSVDSIDTYYLLIYFPKSYSSTIDYEGVMDNIEIKIESEQIIS